MRRRVLLKNKIQERIQEFDLPSLLKVLEGLGYTFETIFFKGHYSSASQSSLIHAIEFSDHGVTLSLNAGLLSANGPLPSFFHKALDQGTFNTPMLLHYLRFFDHHLLKKLVGSLYPEKQQSTWKNDLRYYFSLLNLRSSSTLQWLTQLIFPELECEIQRSELLVQSKIAPFILAKSKLGSAELLGGKLICSNFGYSITLYADDAQDNQQKPWLEVCQDRIRRTIIPFIKDLSLSLTVYLVIRFQDTCLQLNQQSYLGLEALENSGNSWRELIAYRTSSSQNNNFHSAELQPHTQQGVSNVCTG